MGKLLHSSFKMARGPRKHLKRIGAPKHWMLDKLTGVFAPRPSAGPLLRNRLKYALTYAEAKVIMNSRAIQVDGKVRTELCYPCGFMDVLSIEKTGENFRLLHDTKGRFVLHRITQQEAAYKLCRVKALSVGVGKIPYIVTHDGRTIGFSKFEVGNVCVITGGKNIGRVGVIQRNERHQGSHDIVHVKDKTGQSWATRGTNVFVIGTKATPVITLPRQKGIKHGIIEEARRRAEKAAKN